MKRPRSETDRTSARSAATPVFATARRRRSQPPDRAARARERPRIAASHHRSTENARRREESTRNRRIFDKTLLQYCCCGAVRYTVQAEMANQMKVCTTIGGTRVSFFQSCGTDAPPRVRVTGREQLAAHDLIFIIKELNNSSILIKKK